MNPVRFERLERFLAHYSAIHEVDNAYGFSEETSGVYRDAALALYEQSMGYLEGLDLSGVGTVLDVGCGYGHHCAWFASRGLDVTGISTDVSDELIAHASEHGYTLLRRDMHFLDFEDGVFDMVWSHHCLEHSFGPLFALWEWGRVLRAGGVLCVTVPPHKSMVVSGHFTSGWTIGQLLYVLGVMGFDIASGSFVREGYNVRAMVRKPEGDVDVRGISWLHRMRERLPEALMEHLIEHERSPGAIQFEGQLRVLTPTCWEAIESG
ncbi:MAG: methyltransferase domain-containing protein [Planctomycetota bacterium]|jgi:SAM-dependent methyltransferase